MWKWRAQTGVCCLPALALMLGLVGGCKDEPSKDAPQPPPPQPPPSKPCPQPGSTVTVSLNVVRILHDGSGYLPRDVPGGQSNQGCRLTNDQIKQYIAQADRFYGRACHVHLAWDQQIKDHFADLKWGLFQGDTPRNGRTQNHFWVFELQDCMNSLLYENQKVNIFFGGNYKFDPRTSRFSSRPRRERL